MIRAENIHKYYDKLHVLKGVNMNVNNGEIVSIVGASGAGKTTLLQILGTLDKAAESNDSSLKINDINIGTLAPKELAKFRNEHLGFIFQFHQLLPEFTALENVCIPAYIKGTSEKEATEKAKKILDFLALSTRLNHKPSELSGGEQQRVAVARALINDPLLVLADEPSGNLDSTSATQLHQLFFELRDAFGYTFIIVTHNDELANMADRKITITDGQVSS